MNSPGSAPGGLIQLKKEGHTMTPKVKYKVVSWVRDLDGPDTGITESIQGFTEENYEYAVKQLVDNIDEMSWNPDLATKFVVVE